MFSKCKKLRVFIVVCCIVLLSAFTITGSTNQNFKWIQQFLNGCFNSSAGTIKLKKWELSVTEHGFFRLRKYFPNGKQEYFSFNISKFQNLGYLGTASSGNIIIRTTGDDIIVQTYNDPRGNVDSMAQLLSIPVVNIEPAMLDTLKSNMAALKAD